MSDHKQEAGRAAPSQFRKKPVVIDAVQWPGTKFESTPPQWFIDAMYITPGQPGMVMRWEDDILIETLEGRMRAQPGDWIIRGVKGEIYPCKPDIFVATYEPAGVAYASADGLPPPKLWFKQLQGAECKPDGRCYDVLFAPAADHDPLYTAEQVRQAQRDALVPYIEKVAMLEKVLEIVNAALSRQHKQEAEPSGSIGAAPKFKTLIADLLADRARGVESEAYRRLVGYIDAREMRMRSENSEGGNQ